MWKNRRKRLTTTPATASVAELDDNVVGNGSLIPPAVVHQQFDSDNCQFDEEDDEFGFGKLRFFNHALKWISSNNQKNPNMENTISSQKIREIDSFHEFFS